MKKMAWGLSLLLLARVAQAQNQPILRAAEVAQADFAQHLAREDDAGWAYARYVADIHHYSIGISESRNAYVVVFLLRPPPGIRINGGGAEYRVDKRTLKIVGVLGYK